MKTIFKSNDQQKQMTRLNPIPNRKPKCNTYEKNQILTKPFVP